MGASKPSLLSDLRISTMMLLLNLSIKNLFRNKIRSLMTVAGVAVGMALFVAMTSITSNFSSQIDTITYRYKVDLAVQSKGAATPMASRIPSEVHDHLNKMEGVEDTIAIVLGTLSVPWNPYLFVIGMSSDNLQLHIFRLIKGDFFRKGENEIMISADIARIGYDVNQKIMLQHDNIFSITGIYTSEVQMGNASVILDMEVAQRLINRDESVNIIFVRLKDGYDQAAVAAAVNTRLPSLHAIPAGELAGHILVTKVAEAFAIIISTLALIVSCIFISNTLLMSITERTKEIGVLMAIGWSRLMIVKMILSESLLICMAGMVVGNLAGLFLLWIVNYINPAGMGWWLATTPDINIILISAVIAFLTGAFGAVYPALAATRLSAVQALRYE